MNDAPAPARSILITGCSSGIGRDAALTLHARGWRVFAACRKPRDCEALEAEGLASPLIDYESPDTIESGLGAVLEATGGRLDALFNNGAYAIPGLVEDLPTDALRAIFEANLIGWHDLTRRVLPVMRARWRGPDRAMQQRPRFRRLALSRRLRRRRSSRSRGCRTPCGWSCGARASTSR